MEPVESLQEVAQHGGSENARGAGVLLSALVGQRLVECQRTNHTRKGPNRYRPTEYGRGVLKLGAE